MKIKVKQDSELLTYLYEVVDMPKKRIKSLLTNGNIYIQKKQVTKYNFKVYKDMEIIIDKKKDKNLPFDILYEDDYILVVDKPSELLTIATKNERENTLYHYLLEYLKKKNKREKIFIVHRLDKDTSGVVLFAKNKKIKDRLQNNWNTLVKLREYKAVVFGKLEKKQDKLIHYLLESKTNLVYVSESKKGKKAITNYTVEKENAHYSRLNIQIETGKKNQIRVQLAYIGNPIVGDSKYKNKNCSSNKKFSRLYLHANKLVLFYPILKKELVFQSKIPKEFSTLV